MRAIHRAAEHLLAQEALALHHRPVLVQAYVKRRSRPTLMFSSCTGLSPTGTLVASRLGAVDRPDRYHGATLRELLERGSRNVRTLARVELLLADGLLTYARDLGAVSPSRVLASAADRARLEKRLTELGPVHPSYLGLVAAMRRYRAIVERGGWARVRPTRGLVPGRRHPAVGALKRRLAVEGTFEGALDDRFDRALLRAVHAFQRTHQLRKTDRLRRRDRAFWRELNLPARRRLQAILLTIKRWRDQGVGRDPLFVLVNIPAFRLEVWRDGELLLGDHVVVGKPRPMKCDERTRRRVRAHATPVVSSRIERLVFSPYWNVTRDIREKELEPEEGKSPLYYARHGFEVVEAREGRTRVRQLPGPGNALGFVKFVFPNRHQIYLHDTAQKRFFKRRVRALSHGCVRVQRPRVLARLLLSADGQWNQTRYGRLYRRWRSLDFRPLRRRWDPSRYERLRARGRRLRQVVRLRDPVVVHVAYHTAAVDGDGAVHFYRDLYRLDRRALRPRPSQRCVPESVLARRRFDQVVKQLEALEEKARALVPLIPHATVVAKTLLRQGRRTRRVKRRLRALKTFSDQHENLSRRIRSEHDVVADALEPARPGRGRWSRDLQARALRVKRLLDALREMTLAAERVCHGVLEKTTRAAKS